MSCATRPGKLAKRIFDVIVAGGVVLVFSPVLAVLAMIIRRDGGPALYRGARIGKDGVPFRMLKFRSMMMNADKLGPPSTSDDDPRITAVGRVLRRFKIDELPQLVNVVRGEMSLVGPRPEVAFEVDRYTPEERRLLLVRPGMTDYASIKYRNEGEILKGSSDPHETYRQLIRPGKISLGLLYVQQRSMALDIKILVLTLLSIVSHDRALRYVPEPGR